MLIGIFLTSFGLLAFSILSTRLLSVFTGSGMVPVILGVSLLGLGCAAAAVSALSSKTAQEVVDGWLPALCLSSSLAVLGIFAAATWICAGVDQRVSQLLIAGGGESAVRQYLFQGAFPHLLIIGAMMSVQNFLGGLVIASLFRFVDVDRQPALYGMDLLGACCGSISCVFVMEYGGYAWPLALVAGLPLAAGACLARKQKNIWRAGLAIFLGIEIFVVFNPGCASFLEPRPNLQTDGRTYEAYRGGDVSFEKWRSWNSYTRVAELVIKNPEGADRRVFSLGSGTGHVFFDRYVPGDGREPQNIAADFSRVLGTPRRALVFFAGVGSEVLALDMASGGRMDITAVEVNRQMVERALSQKDQGLGNLLSKGNIHFNIAEARTHLERDRSKYDLILAPYFGSVQLTPWATGELSQFMFTREAYRSLLERLSPGGMSVTFDANKVVLLANVRNILESSREVEPARCVIIMSLAPLDRREFFQPQAGPERDDAAAWDSPLDNSALLLKPSGFSPEETRKFRALAKDLGLEMLYDPDTHDIGNPYWQVLRSARLEEALAELGRKSRLQGGPGIRLSERTDDNPRLSLHDFGDLRGIPDRLWLALGIVFGGLALSFATVMPRSRKGAARGDIFWILYFTALGYGFLFIEVGFILKLGLFLGNPVYAMSISLAALLFFSGLGSFHCRAVPSIGWRAMQRVCLATAAAVIAALLLVESAGYALFPLPLGARAMLIALLLGPVGFFLGQLFPLGLVVAQRRSRDWAAWAWVVNGFASAGAVGAAGAIHPVLGSRALLGIGGAIYLALAAGLFIVRVREESSQSRAAEAA